MKQRGFTLVEVAVSCVLISVLVFGVFSFFSTTFVNYLQLEEKTRMQEEVRIVENFIKEEIKTAQKIEIKTFGTVPPGDFNQIELEEQKLIYIKLDQGTEERLIQVISTEPNRLYYSAGGTNSVLTDLLKEGSIYISKEKDSDIITVKIYLEKQRNYRPNHPTTVHSFTTYIKIPLKYKDVIIL